MHEADALDKAMEDRIVARKGVSSSRSSVASIDMGPAWKSRYDNRRRTGSIRSTLTTSTILTENLLDEEERADLTGMDYASDGLSLRTTSPGTDASEDEVPGSGKPTGQTNRPAKHFLSPIPDTPQTARAEIFPRPGAMRDLPSNVAQCPPSAPASRFSFNIPRKFKRRPPPLGLGLSPVPSSPIAPVLPPACDPRPNIVSHTSAPPFSHRHDLPHVRGKMKPPPLHMPAPTPTLFVFPPEPIASSRTPSTMTVMSNLIPSVSHQSPQTPRVSTIKFQGRSKSFVSFRTPPTPSVASSRVDAYGWIGIAAP